MNLEASYYSKLQYKYQNLRQMSDSSSIKIRSNVQTQLKLSIEQCLDQNSDEFSKKSDLDKYTTSIEEIAKKVEEALYLNFNKDSGNEYRAQARTLVNGLKNNAQLCSDLLSRKIELSYLISLPASELISIERRKQDEQLLEQEQQKLIIPASAQTENLKLQFDGRVSEKWGISKSHAALDQDNILYPE